MPAISVKTESDIFMHSWYSPSINTCSDQAHLTKRSIVGEDLIRLDEDGHDQFLGRGELHVDPVAVIVLHQVLHGLIQDFHAGLNPLQQKY